ncbi:MAG: LysR family transcriptional regulator [Novosphingobium sp.]|nr:LysR family transcriptional regulator [Novosphingobium sp.]
MSGLNAVSVAARLGSLSRAADMLNLSQPALSRRITEAERLIGVPLFERLPRGVKATDACLAFLSHAEIALTSIDEGISAALCINNNTIQNLSVGLLEVFCDPVIMACCRKVVSKYDGAKIDFKAMHWSSEVSADLMSGRIKLGIRYRKDVSSQLESVWIADDPVIVACSASHALARRDSVTIKDLQDSRWIGAPMAIDRANEYYQEGLRFLGFEDWQTSEVTSIFARTRLIEAGFGVALVRRACVEEELQRGSLVELRTPLSMSIPIFLAWRRGAHLGDMAEELISELRGRHEEG